MIRMRTGEMPQGVKLETSTGHKFQETVEDEQPMPRRETLRSTVTAVAAWMPLIFKGIRRQGHSEARRHRIQRASEGTERLERARTSENEFFEEVLRREDKKRKLAEKLPNEADEGFPPAQRVEDDTMGANGDSDHIIGLAARLSQASSSSGLNDEDRKRALEQSQQREAKNRKVVREASTLKRKRKDGRDEDKDDSRQRRDEAMCTESTEEECLAKTGKAPVTTKWVRVNKGTSSNPFIRARLVARDFGGESLFAAMPPLEAKKLLFRMAAKEQCVWRRGK